MSPLPPAPFRPLPFVAMAQAMSAVKAAHAEILGDRTSGGRRATLSVSPAVTQMLQPRRKQANDIHAAESGHMCAILNCNQFETGDDHCDTMMFYSAAVAQQAPALQRDSHVLRQRKNLSTIFSANVSLSGN